MDKDAGFVRAEWRIDKRQWDWEQTSKLAARQFHWKFLFVQAMHDYPQQYKLFRLLWAAQGFSERYRRYLCYKQGVKFGRQKQKKASAP